MEIVSSTLAGQRRGLEGGVGIAPPANDEVLRGDAAGCAVSRGELEERHVRGRPALPALVVAAASKWS